MATMLLLFFSLIHLCLYFLHCLFILHWHRCEFLANPVMDFHVFGYTAIQADGFSLGQVRLLVLGRDTFLLAGGSHSVNTRHNQRLLEIKTCIGRGHRFSSNTGPTFCVHRLGRWTVIKRAPNHKNVQWSLWFKTTHSASKILVWC